MQLFFIKCFCTLFCTTATTTSNFALRGKGRRREARIDEGVQVPITQGNGS